MVIGSFGIKLISIRQATTMDWIYENLRNASQ